MIAEQNNSRRLTSINGLNPEGEDSVGSGRAHIEAMPCYVPVVLTLQPA